MFYFQVGHLQNLKTKLSHCTNEANWEVARYYLVTNKSHVTDLCQTGVLADTGTSIFSGIRGIFQYWYIGIGTTLILAE